MQGLIFFMGDKNMKKNLSFFIFLTGILFVGLVSCDGTVDNSLFSKHKYVIQTDGSWVCSDCKDVLKGTDSAYITVLGEDGQPTEIISLSKDTNEPCGVGQVVVDGTDISYSNTTSTQEVVIRTTSASMNLTINAFVDSKDSSGKTGDIVRHYDRLGVLEISQVANGSFYENGLVAFAELTAGRFVLEENSDVKIINIKKITDISYSNPIIADGGVKTMPEIISRDQVSISSSTKLVQIQVLKDGEINKSEQIYVYPYISKGSTEKTGSQNSKISTTLGVAVLDGGSNPGVNALSQDEKEEKENTEVGKIIKEEVSGKETKFGGGKGTEAEPYLVYDYATMQLMGDFCDLGYFYYKVDYRKTDNGSIDLKYWNPIKFNGSFDGSNAKIENLDSVLFSSVKDSTNGTVIKDIDITCNISDLTVSGAAIAKTASHVMTFNNVDIHGLIRGSTHVASYFAFGGNNNGTSADQHYTFINCVSDANVVSMNGEAGGMWGNALQKEGESFYTIFDINDSAYIGNLQAKDKGTCFMASYMAGSHKDALKSGDELWNQVNITYSQDFFNQNVSGMYTYKTEEGQIVSPTVGSFKLTTQSGQGFNNEMTYINKSGLTADSLTLPANKGDVFEVSKAYGATYAKAYLLISPNDFENETGSYTTTYLTEDIDLSNITGSTFKTSKIKYFNIDVNAEGVKKQGADGTYYHVYDGNKFYGTTHNGASVYVIQYSQKGGDVVQMSSVVIAKPITPDLVHININELSSTGVIDRIAGRSFVYDTGVDLSDYDVVIKYVSRDANSGWSYGIGDNTEIMSTSDYEINGQKITIKSCKAIPININYDYFVGEIGKSQVSGDQFKKILITYTLKQSQ